MKALTWLGRNWKSIGALLLAIGTAIISYTQQLDARIDKIEVAAVEVRRDIDDVAEDVVDIRCMAVKSHQGGDPLSCLIGKSIP